MKKILSSGIGRLRIVAFLEGFSLLLLLFVAVPLKYIGGHASMVSAVGPVHGALVMLYLFTCFNTALEYRWTFSKLTWKLICACMIPFGTFYADRKVFRPVYLSSQQ